MGSSSVTAYANALLRNAMPLDDITHKKKPNTASKLFENLNKAIHNDTDAESSGTLRNTKESVISELLYQTKKIEVVKAKNSTTTDKLSNFQNKKPRKSTQGV